jgi:hypothetical protein
MKNFRKNELKRCSFNPNGLIKAKKLLRKTNFNYNNYSRNTKKLEKYKNNLNYILIQKKLNLKKI